MNVHEFQAKQLLGRYEIPVPPGSVAATVEEAVAAAQRIGGARWALKAQVYAGGRGAGHFKDGSDGAGGVRLVDSLAEVRSHAGQMLGQVLVTEQTGALGREVERVYVEQACAVERELYLAMLVDRETSRVTLIASPEGGMDIESVAARSPERIVRIAAHPLQGLEESQAAQAAAALRLEGAQAEEAERIVLAMYRLFIELDASLIEVNPLALLADGRVLALDAVLAFDDNALFRHAEISAMRDQRELRLGELEASHHGLNYIKLDGNIGCLASGAGLAMATIDAVVYDGGEPANFLDVPPDTQVGRVKDAFNLILSDPGVDCMLVNVFGGGIMRCDTIADAILLANLETPVRVPLVVRLAGTNAELGRRRLRDSGPPVEFASDLADAARKAVRAAGETRITLRKTWWQRAQGLLASKS